ncbi:MAG: hypothetical protein PF630_12845 [Gammaproteobacteria bacterium]|nr:hypothetical protein [Gammaproteobacteria bacterium]
MNFTTGPPLFVVLSIINTAAQGATPPVDSVNKSNSGVNWTGGSFNVKALLTPDTVDDRGMDHYDPCGTKFTSSENSPGISAVVSLVKPRGDVTVLQAGFFESGPDLGLHPARSSVNHNDGYVSSGDSSIRLDGFTHDFESR